MKNIIILFFILFIFSHFAEAKTIKIAVIDTGFDFDSSWPEDNEYGLVNPKLCDGLHKDFVRPEKLLPHDNYGHGTHVAGLIAKGMKGEDYCLVILKYYDPQYFGNNLLNTIKSFKYAVDIGVDYINYSGGGLEYSIAEKKEVMRAIKKGIKIAAAAGNEHTNSDFNKYYPAQYDPRIIVVGNRAKEKQEGITVTDEAGRIIKIASSSNYCSCIDYYEYGIDIWSLAIGGGFISMTGTSQSTPIALVKEIKKDILENAIRFYEKTKNMI